MKRKFFIPVLLAVLALLGLVRAAGAHGHTEVGDYELAIGFQNEPAYQGEPNALDLMVTDTRTGERVSGLEETLDAEIIFGSSRKTLRLEPQFGVEGAYSAYVLPTQPGDYTWRIFGTIEDTPVDVSMTSSPDTFSSVEPKTTFSFPNAEPAGSDLLADLEGAQQMARTALIVGVGGLLLGLGGIVLAANGLRTKRR